MEDKLIGLKGKKVTKVTEEKLASSIKSGLLDVFATPCMVALMEDVANSLLQEHLPEGITSVGTALDIKHVAPTPVGAVVTAVAEIIESDGRNFKFKVEAFDEIGLIGEGYHNRSTVKVESFLESANKRRK